MGVTNLSFLFRLDKLQAMNQRAFLNTTVAIYDSQDPELMNFCTTEWIRIDKDHVKLEEKYNVASISTNEIVEV